MQQTHQLPAVSGHLGVTLKQDLGGAGPGRVSRPLSSESVLQSTSKASTVGHGGHEPWGHCPEVPLTARTSSGCPWDWDCSWSTAGAQLAAPTRVWSPAAFRAQRRSAKPGNVPLAGLRRAKACSASALNISESPTAARPARCCPLVLGMRPGHCPHCQGCHGLRHQGRGQKGTVRFCTARPTERASYLELLSCGGVTVSPQKMYLNMGFISFPEQDNHL